MEMGVFRGCGRGRPLRSRAFVWPCWCEKLLWWEGQQLPGTWSLATLGGIVLEMKSLSRILLLQTFQGFCKPHIPF